MSLALLGSVVDVHVGGIDLRFPHHENERAQTNAIAGEEVVRNWIHGEHLLFEGKKMAKSSGNVILVSDISAKGFDLTSTAPCAPGKSLQISNRYDMAEHLSSAFDSEEMARVGGSVGFW